MLIFLTILALILVLGLLIFVHEFGHFITAKWSNVKVEEFAFGFPPRLFAWRKGETRYSLNAVPFGGYVKMLGEERRSNDPRSYSQQSAGRRAKIVVAGVVMNGLLAWVLFTIWYAVAITRPPANAVLVAHVLKGSAAEAAGLRSGDLLVAGEGLKFINAEAVGQFTRSNVGGPVVLTVRRFGQDVTKTVNLGSDKEAPLGVRPVDLGVLPKELVIWQSPWYALRDLGLIIWSNAIFLGQLVSSIFRPTEVSIQDVSGPVGIYGYLSQMVSIGPLYVLRFTALLSLVVAFFNILPLPALDGGKLVFVLAELISRRRVVREQIEEVIHAVGFGLLIILILLVTYQDIAQLVRFRL